VNGSYYFWELVLQSRPSIAMVFLLFLFLFSFCVLAVSRFKLFSIPSVSSIYLKIHGQGSLLMDCGEGSYGQLELRYGTKKLEEILTKELKAVMISHIHADHHLGIIRILAERERLLASQDGDSARKKLLIMGPKLLHSWLREYGFCEDLASFEFVDFHSLSKASASFHMYGISSFLLPYSLFCLIYGFEIRESLGLSCFATEVIHCYQSYGFAINHQSGWKIVYHLTTFFPFSFLFFSFLFFFFFE